MSFEFRPELESHNIAWEAAQASSRAFDEVRKQQAELEEFQVAPPSQPENPIKDQMFMRTLMIGNERIDAATAEFERLTSIAGVLLRNTEIQEDAPTEPETVPLEKLITVKEEYGEQTEVLSGANLAELFAISNPDTSKSIRTKSARVIIRDVGLRTWFSEYVPEFGHSSVKQKEPEPPVLPKEKFFFDDEVRVFERLEGGIGENRHNKGIYIRLEELDAVLSYMVKHIESFRGLGEGSREILANARVYAREHLGVPEAEESESV